MKTKLILLLIFFLALVLRLYQVGTVPPSLYWDEVSMGYNSYSIIQTGKDEWGRVAPMFFEAFGEFKFPVAVYLTALPIATFGLTEFAVRFSSAFLGGLTIFGIYLLARRIFAKEKISLIASFIFAISPWSIQFSRGLFEANISLFFLTWSLFFLISFCQKQTKLKFAGFLGFSVFCIYSYGVSLMVLPIISAITVTFFSLKKTWGKIKLIALILILLGITYLPFLFHIKNNTYSRFNQISIFSQNETLEKIINLRTKYGPLSKIIFNQYSAGLINFSNNLVQYVDPRFLWPGEDGNPRHYTGFGLIYPIEFVSLIFGVVYLFPKNKKTLGFLILFCLVPFVSASLTKDSPHALRAQSSLIPICLVSSFGIYIIAKKRVLKIIGFLAFLLVMNLYLSKYFDHSLKSFSAWGMENKIMMLEAKRYNRQKIIYLTGDYWRPYVYYYFFSKISPKKVQENNNSTKIGNVYFGYAKWDKGDRRYDFNFKPESLFQKDSYVLFLSGSEKDYFAKMLRDENAVLKRDFDYNNNYIFSIYEK